MRNILFTTAFILLSYGELFEKSIVGQIEKDIAVQVNESIINQPNNYIVNEWRRIDVTGPGRKRFLASQVQAKKKGKQYENSYVEFTKEGLMNYYENGRLNTKGTYTMSPDGRTLYMHMSYRPKPVPMKILHLTSTSLKMTSEIPKSDTVLYSLRQ